MKAEISQLSGPSIWLEPESLHFHAGGVAQARVLRGSMMRREGPADMQGLSGYALDPAGNRLEADIAPGGGDHLLMAFFTGGEGLYNLVLDNESGNVIQRSRITVPVGHDLEGAIGDLKAPGLDIFTAQFRGCRPGDRASIKVLFDGKPLAGAKVAATYHIYEGADYPWTGVTGEDGIVDFTFTGKGHWMFIVSHTGEGGKEHTATFVVAGVR